MYIQSLILTNFKLTNEMFTPCLTKNQNISRRENTWTSGMNTCMPNMWKCKRFPNVQCNLIPHEIQFCVPNLVSLALIFYGRGIVWLKLLSQTWHSLITEEPGRFRFDRGDRFWGIFVNYFQYFFYLFFFEQTPNSRSARKVETVHTQKNGNRFLDELFCCIVCASRFCVWSKTFSPLWKLTWDSKAVSLVQNHQACWFPPCSSNTLTADSVADIQMFERQQVKQKREICCYSATHSAEQCTSCWICVSFPAECSIFPSCRMLLTMRRGSVVFVLDTSVMNSKLLRIFVWMHRCTFRMHSGWKQN